LRWNGSTRGNTIRLTGDAGTIALADDRLIQTTAAGVQDVKYAAALSAGSHHADWFAAFIPQLAACFRDPESSRTAFDEASACLDIIRQAYAVGSGQGIGAGDRGRDRE